MWGSGLRVWVPVPPPSMGERHGDSIVGEVGNNRSIVGEVGNNRSAHLVPTSGCRTLSPKP